ncbi:MAG: hypothetical protein J1F43_05520, partial [Muribaculaceae bacterium]|nr:hypothetical protein [Muribaculaceae bacterium]
MKYLSFDVFDTCLIRACGLPENIFRIIGRKIFDSKDPNYFELISNFCRIRQEAELAARKCIKAEE